MRDKIKKVSAPKKGTKTSLRGTTLVHTELPVSLALVT